MYTSQICLIETNLKALAILYNSSKAGLKLLKAVFLKSAGLIFFRLVKAIIYIKSSIASQKDAFN